MRYHNITKDDMLNGDGLRVVLWVSGCEHRCAGCQNPITWNPEDGLLFDEAARTEIFDLLGKSYISGITFSGGDPLYEENCEEILQLCSEIRERFPEKTIWLYTGYTWEYINSNYVASSKYKLLRKQILNNIDVLVDGKFMLGLKNVKYHWAGSTNQRVIDVQSSIEKNCIVLKGEHIDDYLDS